MQHVFVDDKPAIEFLAGRPVRKVSPKHRHSVVQAALCRIIRGLAEGRGTVGPEWRFRLCEASAKQGKTHLVPDVAYVSYARWRALPKEQRQEPPFAPDVAVEVRSPSDSHADRLWKVRAYLENGALLVLDVVPETRSITAHSHDGVREFQLGDAFQHEAVPWLRFDVAEAFADLEDDE